ncbi:hypothetical protein C0584_02820 [Candidatus Parcubacteria bacterium]|mgnify:CR=1 FL=1|nr:MAG: hypothetical protein C0584_02820 [Candidatus Parcubacteria bacterium]
MNKTNKKENTPVNAASQLPGDSLTREPNPIDEVIEKMLKKDAKSCKLASARLSQINQKKNEKDKKN